MNVQSIDTTSADAGAEPGKVSDLDQTLWGALADDGATHLASGAHLTAWLSLLAAGVEAMRAGTVVLPEGEGMAPVAIWPAGAELPGGLTGLAGDALEAGRPMLRAAGDAAGETDLAVPLAAEGAAQGVAAIRLGTGDRRAAERALRAVRWGAGWLREHLARQNLSAARAARDHAHTALGVFAATLEERRLRPAVMAFVTDLARRFDCDRVSLGFLRRGSAKVYAISETARFSRQMNLARLLGAAMDEAVDQSALIAWPPDPDAPLATRAHEQLSRGHGADAILTVPLFDAERFMGAVTLERRGEGAAFAPSECDAVEFVASCIAPMLADKRANARWLPRRIADATLAGARALLGPRHVRAKLATLGVVAVAAVLATWRTDYAVPASARVDGTLRRAIIAPYDGILESASVRPGDRVAKGDVLLTLDDRELTLQRLEAETERRQQERLYEKALGERNRAELGVIRARIDRARARIRLIDDRIARATRRAPFDGLVVDGDLRQRIGDAVRAGEQLMEIAPLERWKVVLQVPARSIDEIEVGQTGRLVATSLPEATFPFEVNRITPMSEVREGQLVFQVEGRLESGSERLSPGMEGVGKIAVDERLMIDVWTRPAIDWLSLFVWRWWP